MPLVENSQHIDTAYKELDFKKDKLEHLYGENIHILNDPVALSELAALCQAKTRQPLLNSLVKELYQFLIRKVMRYEFPKAEVNIKTRMASISKNGEWTGSVIKTLTKTVSVNIMRAGSLPSQVSFDFLNRILEPDCVRQDHLVMSRVINERNKVTGAEIYGSKIGGDISDSIVLFPDPMGATGSSLVRAIDYYKEKVSGTPKAFIGLHLMITPEFIQKIKKAHPDVKIYSLRLDRGMSSTNALEEIPGKLIDEESGLNENQYIVPGAGGLGELMNNAYC